MNPQSDCVFCGIVAEKEPASKIYEDDKVISFMSIQPIHPGESVVIPKVHIDHFTDIDDDTAQHLIFIAQRIGRRMRQVFQPKRVGMIVHGFGVPHAHLILVPQHHPDDLTSGRFAHLEEGKIIFSLRHIPIANRSVLDEHARLLAIGR